MPFGLTNAPATFQNFINDVLHPFLDLFVTAYLDNIVIFLENLKHQKRHVQEVLGALQKNGLHLAAEKYEFHRTSVKYLGFIISTKGCVPDPAKIETVVNWGKQEDESLESKDIAKKKKFSDLTSFQQFLGFANFYRRFIKNYSRIVAPLTKHSGKDNPFVWKIEWQATVDTLITAFTTVPILRHFDHDCEIIVETGASDSISASILSQYDDDEILHLVAFFSKKQPPAECNDKIYVKELLAIVRCF